MNESASDASVHGAQGACPAKSANRHRKTGLATRSTCGRTHTQRREEWSHKCPFEWFGPVVRHDASHGQATHQLEEADGMDKAELVLQVCWQEGTVRSGQTRLGRLVVGWRGRQGAIYSGASEREKMQTAVCRHSQTLQPFIRGPPSAARTRHRSCSSSTHSASFEHIVRPVSCRSL